MPHVAVVGAGPTGLEAALAAAERGWSVTLYEGGDRVGGNVRGWGHVRLFTPWSLNLSPRMRRHLEAAGAATPAGDDLPTGDELVERVLNPLAALPEVAPALRLGTRVVAVGRQGLTKEEEIGSEERARRPFRLLVSDEAGERVEHADVVIDCTGVYGNPNSLGDGGIPAPGERALEGRISRHLPDLAAEAPEWAGRRVLLVGAGHSAQTAARDLAELARHAAGTEVTWAVRSPDPDWQAVPDDTLAQRAALVADAKALRAGASPAVRLRAGRVVEGLRERDGRVAVTLRNGEAEEVEVDRVLSLTGGVGDHGLYRQLQVHECYATSAPMQLSAALLGAGAGSGDCLDQESHGVDVLRNPEPNFFILGEKSHGRFGLYLMRIGYEQVNEVMGLLAGAPS